MFGKLFAESGLSLDRLRVLIEVGASGSIVRAAAGDPVRQSQYSRQLKELEDFFQTSLVERHGKGIRLTVNGKELARISRFFLLGLSNFQRGCFAEGQRYRIGACATFNHAFLVPLLAKAEGATVRFTVQTLPDDEIERRLHDLTLDFGILMKRIALSRPLQLRKLGSWQLKLWVPKALYSNETAARAALRKRLLPFASPAAEVDLSLLPGWEKCEPALVCDNFLEIRAALSGGRLAALLPDFLPPAELQGYLPMNPVVSKQSVFACNLAWNPRLLRLNPHAARRRDALVQQLSRCMRPAD